MFKKENSTSPIKKTDEHLLEKYRIPNMGDYSKPGSVLCDILQRLDTNKKLDEVDKKWIRDKGMFNFYKFLENWEDTGTPNFDDIKSHYKAPKPKRQLSIAENKSAALNFYKEESRRKREGRDCPNCNGKGGWEVEVQTSIDDMMWYDDGDFYELINKECFWCSGTGRITNKRIKEVKKMKRESS
jgi:hypothetical protein